MIDAIKGQHLQGRRFSKGPFVGEIESTHRIFRSGKDRDLDTFLEKIFFKSLRKNHAGHGFLILFNETLHSLDQCSRGFLLEPALIAVGKDDSVHVVSFEHFFNDEGVELEFKQIPEIQRILQVDDVGPETAFHFLQDLFRKAGEGKSVVGAGVGCYDGMASGPGDNHKAVSPQRRQGLRFEIVHAVIHGVEANAPGLFQGIIHEPVIGKSAAVCE